MPLSQTVSRSLVHHREIDCRGYSRDDGLWDIEAHLVDTKTYSFPNHERGIVTAGEPIHGMWIRITVDEALVIRAVETTTDHSPFGECQGIAPAYGQLVGVRIGRSFDATVAEMFGGAHGCVHLRELLRPLATTAYQTIGPARARRQREAAPEAPPSGPPEAAAKRRRPSAIDSCHALRADSPVVQRQWPDHYAGPAPGAAPPDPAS
jgi:hypothetical protein